MSQQLKLLLDHHFTPLFMTQFLGAFNDNLFKTALVVMLAYGTINTGTTPPAILVSTAAAIFILPFILLSPLAGQLAESHSKTRLTLQIKFAEILISILGIVALYAASPVLSLLTLGALGAQSAFFSPCKYGLLPEILSRKDLMAANGLISSGTYIAILLGTIIGALFATTENGTTIISAIMFTCAASGFATALAINTTPAANPSLKVSINPVKQIKSLLKALPKKSSNTHVIGSIIGVSWFYFIAATFHAQFPNFAKETLAVDPPTLAFFMLTFSLGIGIGSLLNNKILGAAITPTWVPFAAFGIALFSADLYLSASGIPPATTLTTLPQFLSTMSGWRITLDLLGLSLCGGLYVVPLKAIIQDRTKRENRGRVLAGSALLDSIAILTSALIAIALIAAGLKIVELFLTLSIATAFSSLILLKLTPQHITAKFLANLFKKRPIEKQ